MASNREHKKFDEYILWHWTAYILKPGNHIIMPGGGKKLKPGAEYKWTDTPNPNPMQVEQQVWQELITKHLRRYNYN